MRFPNRMLPIAAIALLASACGSAASAAGGSSQAAPPTTSQPKVHLTSAQLVDRMVLHSGDLLNFVVRSKGVEKLEDQLAHPHTPNAAAINRVTRAGWVVSEHSVIAANPDFPVISDANLYRSATWAQRVWAAERAGTPKSMHVGAAPAGSPAGAIYYTGFQGKYTGFEVIWRQGRVIGLSVMLFPKNSKITAALRVEISSVLSRAASAESGRIAAALSA